jgi:aspartate-semialdehyde dehydrogenase
MTTDRIRVGVLGATGVVGQRLVSLLDGHPWFELATVAASERSVGHPYGVAAEWQLAEPMPEAVAELEVVDADADLRVPLVFSALGSGPAADLEPLHAGRGVLVVSNASRFRMDPEVPLLVPEVNPDALALLAQQRWAPGGIVTNPNCMVTGLALALAPLHVAFGVERMVVTSLQALSGAGYPGVPSLAAVGNVVPYIGGEEDKIESEPLKILDADFPISAAAHRVPVRDGHLASVHLDLAGDPSTEEIGETLEAFRGEPQERRLPTAPERPLFVHRAADRPQPALDVDLGRGMTVSVGRLRDDRLFTVRFDLLVHNTLRGAAGAALLNAELAVARGLVAAAGRGVVEAGS